MDREETLVDIVARLEKTTARLETLLDGSPAFGVEGLNSRVAHLERQIAIIQEQRVSAWQWMMGYVLFVVGVITVSHGNVTAIGLTPTAGIVIGALAWVLAAVFFLSGLGWLKWR